MATHVLPESANHSNHVRAIKLLLQQPRLPSPNLRCDKILQSAQKKRFKEDVAAYILLLNIHVNNLMVRFIGFLVLRWGHSVLPLSSYSATAWK